MPPLVFALDLGRTHRHDLIYQFVCQKKPAPMMASGEEPEMTVTTISRRSLLRAAGAVPLGAVLSPALIGKASAAVLKMRLSSSQANDPKFANGRVYYDNLTKQLKAANLSEQIEVQFFPDNQLGQEIDVINSVKLGVI